MKLSTRWLAEWVESPWPARELGSRLTMSGFELEALQAAGGDSSPAQNGDASRGDALLELNVTPNRGDAMSIIGIAREVAALSGNALRGPALEAVPAKHGDIFPVELAAPEACPRFVGRIIRGVDNRAATPAWLKERLQLSGIRSISPVVDVTNYVMLELGQPMHAYDLARVRQGIRVRMAQRGEKLELLDGRVIEAEPDVLLITDANGGIGLAGIMGGAGTAVTESTRDVLFEAAYFAPAAVLGRARRFGLQTDAGQRFERGVDSRSSAAGSRACDGAVAGDRRRQPRPDAGHRISAALAGARQSEPAALAVAALARWRRRAGPSREDAHLAGHAGDAER